MTITTLDGLVAALPTATTALINKASIATQGAGGWSSLWRATGTPTQGAIPAGAATCTDATTGALATIAAPGGGQSVYLAALALASGSAGLLVCVVDRLAHMGGLSGTTATAQTVGVDVSGLTTRRASDYRGVCWWLEVYTDIGATPVTATVTYTNAAGTTGRTTTLTIGGASPLNQDSRIFPIIGSGGEAIQSIQSIQHATTGTAGSYGITATREIASVACPPVANYGANYDWAALALPTVADDACISFVVFCTTTSTGALIGSAKIVTG